MSVVFATISSADSKVRLNENPCEQVAQVAGHFLVKSSRQQRFSRLHGNVGGQTPLWGGVGGCMIPTPENKQFA